MRKYIYGIIFFLILILAAYIYFSSVKKINPELFYPENISKIDVNRQGNWFTVQDRKKIGLIANSLRRSKEVEIDAVNINKNFTDLYFLFKKGKTERVRISENAYHGNIISVTNTFYKNDSILLYINPD